MLRRGMVGLALAALLVSAPSLAVERDDFVVATLTDLVDVCTTPESDPLYVAGLAFCQGYVVGAVHYHLALHGGKAKPVVCPPQPTPTRTQAIDRFVAWAKAHPDYANERPVEALVKFLVDTWPCEGDTPAR